MEEDKNIPEEQATESGSSALVASGSKRDWTSYIKEFLMLFLAVFAGFMAENYRDTLSEEARAKELAISFYEELKIDSINVEIKIQNKIKQEKALKYLMEYFKDSTLINVSKTFSINFMYGINFRTPFLFEPRTVILDQLKNSGALRYFKSNELQKLIGELSVAIRALNEREELETKIRFEYFNRLTINHYDYDFDSKLRNLEKSIFLAVEEYEKSNAFFPFDFKSLDKFDKQGTVNAIGFLRININSNRVNHYKNYKELNANVLSLLRKEYYLI
jgi:hypothetical protein